MMSLIRRRHRSDPLEITTSPAPVLGGPHVDVDTDDVPVVAAPPADLQVSEADDQVSTALHELVVEYDDDRRPIDRGTCYHDRHVELDGRRVGLLFTDARKTSASLLPCPYLGKAGL